MRVWAGFTAIAYGGGIGFIVALLVWQGDYADVRTAAFLIAPAAISVGAFIWGVVVWNTRLAWAVRVVAWLVLAGSTIYPFISFSFVLAPLILTALPALWPWQVRWKKTCACC